MVDIVESLKEIGLNSYEAKVYIALLKKYPATGYEVSKLANIPQSRTYVALIIPAFSRAMASNVSPNRAMWSKDILVMTEASGWMMLVESNRPPKPTSIMAISTSSSAKY